MNYVTYFDDARTRFYVVVATGPNTKPTPDGGPWATEYEVPPHHRHRLARISENAEELLRRMLRDHAPDVLARAVAMGWFLATPSSGEGESK